MEKILTVRDIIDELNLYGFNVDWKEKSLKDVLEYNGYKIIDNEFIDCEYSDIKGYLGVEIKRI